MKTSSSKMQKTVFLANKKSSTRKNNNNPDKSRILVLDLTIITIDTIHHAHLKVTYVLPRKTAFSQVRPFRSLLSDQVPEMIWVIYNQYSSKKCKQRRK